MKHQKPLLQHPKITTATPPIVAKFTSYHNTKPKPEAKDFIRAGCNETCIRRPDAARACYELLLLYAAFINGSYNRASLAIATVMVSKLADLADDLRWYGETGSWLDGCVRVLEEAVAGARVQALPTLGRMSAIADNKLEGKDPDFLLIWNWLRSVDNNFVKCWDGGLKRIKDRAPSSIVADHSEYATAAIFFRPRPNWTPQSPDEKNP
uniref:Pectinesterase inhibitor domain-containing protein n=1 Tax=Setaria italica TaxID=4555 RepID=K3ZDL1_SETIT